MKKKTKIKFLSKDKPVAYCCDMMKFHLGQYFDNPESADAVIKYNATFDEYGLPIRDGGSSSIGINYCPWCGTHLSASRRDDWFDALNNKGYHSPFTDDIPKKFQSSDWYRK